MSFFDDSSLAFLPSGAAGKDGKAYSIKPIPEYGSEVVTNGNFNSDLSGWTINNAGAGNIVEWSSGEARLKRIVSAATELRQDSLTIGKQYYLRVDVRMIGDALGAAIEYNGSQRFTLKNGVNSLKFTATATLFGFICLSNTTEYYIDNVSVKEVLVADGDFTFSRGSNLAATRVGPTGLIEKGRENLLLQSNNFDTTWGKSSASVTSGQSGYDGSSDAWLLSAVNGYPRITQGISTSGVNTYSVYAKANTTDFILLRCVIGGSEYAIFDLSNGTSTFLSTTFISGNATSVGNGWYRISLLFNGSSTEVAIGVSTDGTLTGWANATNESIYIQDAQLEIGLAATEVITTGATTGKAGLLEDEPRFDYSGGATCPSLLLEPSRINLVPQSEYLSGLSLGNSPTITQNYAVSPEGVQNAVRIQDTDATNFKTIQTQFSISAGSTYTISVYVKKATSPITTYGGFYFDFDGGTRKISNLIFDEYNGTLVNASGNAITSVIHPVIDEGDYWRFSATATDTGSNTLLRATLRAGASTDGTSLTPVIKDYTAYGLQCEQGSYPTSYIPNHSGGTITRGADDCTGAGDASTFNDSEGVLYAEISALANDGTFRNISVSNGTTAQAIRIYYRSNDDQITFLLGSSSGGGITTSIPSATDYIKVAAKYDTDTIKLFVNGALINTISSLTMPTGLQQLDFNIANVLPFYGNAKQVLYFPTALSDADCITLTT